MDPLISTPDTQSYYGLGGLVGQAYAMGKTLGPMTDATAGTPTAAPPTP